MAWRRVAKAPRFPPRIACERVVLRPYKYSDVEDICSYANDEEWSRFISPPHPYRREYAEKFIDDRISGHSSDWAGWCVDYGDRMIGCVDLLLNATHKSAEMAYNIARKHWNKGLMTEALAAVIAEAFRSEPPVNRLFVRVDSRNARSIRVVEKLGFRQEGILRQNRLHKRQFIDDIILALLRQEYDSHPSVKSP